MCMGCVSQSLPYVAVALGGLRLAGRRGLLGTDDATNSLPTVDDVSTPGPLAAADTGLDDATARRD